MNPYKRHLPAVEHQLHGSTGLYDYCQVVRDKSLLWVMNPQLAALLGINFILAELQRNKMPLNSFYNRDSSPIERVVSRIPSLHLQL